MSDPCDKGPEIETLRRVQTEQGVHIKAILEHQVQYAKDTKESLDKLTEILIEGNTTRLEVEQGKKERAILFDKARSVEHRVDVIDIRNAKCDGAGIFDEWPSIRSHVQQEKGIRRFIPAVMTFICAAIVIWEALSS